MELHNDELAFNLKTYGTPDMVKATIQRIKEKNNWGDFIDNYPYDGTHINPHSITKIVVDYYDNSTHKPTFAEKNGLVFVEEKIIETYNPLFELYGEQIVYIYKDNSGNIFKRTERSH